MAGFRISGLEPSGSAVRELVRKLRVDRTEIVSYYISESRRKVIPVTGHGSPHGCETSRLPHFLDSRLTDSGEVVSLARRPPVTPRKIPGTHFC
jgi:hypothetical protein